MADNDRLMDIRVVERNIRKGLVSRDDLSAFLNALADKESNAEVVDLEAEEAKAAAAAAEAAAAREAAAAAAAAAPAPTPVFATPGSSMGGSDAHSAETTPGYADAPATSTPVFAPRSEPTAEPTAAAETTAEPTPQPAADSVTSEPDSEPNSF